MKPVLSDRESLLSVRPSEIEEHLRRWGWTQHRREDGLAALWVRHDDASGRELRAIVPLDMDLGDYASRVADVLRVLETIERRPAQDVFRDLKHAGEQFDAFEIAIERDDIVDGLIPITVGSKAFRGTRDIFVAAAASELVEPQAVHPTKLSGMAQEALRHTFLSQTREGSYVINVVSKLPSQQHLQLRRDDEESAQRRVFKRVVIALEAVRQAAEENTADAFAARIDSGVSWNLCRAVTRFAGGRHFKKVSFTPKWLPDEQRPSDIPDRVVFYPKMISAVRAGAVALRAIKPIHDFSLIGKVVELKSRSDQEHEGVVVVEGLIDGTALGKVSMALKGEEHAVALQAYDSKANVLCVGTLHMGVQTHRLLTVKVFKFAGSRDSVNNDLDIGSPPSRERINVNEPWEVRYWCTVFGCTEAQLEAAVRSVGPMLKDVRSYLGR